MIAILVLIFIYTLGLATVSTIYSDSIPGNQSKVLQFLYTEQIIFGFVLFMSVIWLGFIWNLYEFILSFAVSTWYFSREKSLLYVISHLGATVSSFKICLSVPFGFDNLPVDNFSDFFNPDFPSKAIRRFFIEILAFKAVFW